MGNSWKVAKWEIKRNLKNKSFIISMLLTPLIFLAFASIGYFVGNGEEEGADYGEMEPLTVHIIDEADVEGEWGRLVNEQGLPIHLEFFDGEEGQLREQVQESEDEIYAVVDEQALNEQHIVFFAADDYSMNHFAIIINSFEILLQAAQLEGMGLTAQETSQVLSPYVLELSTIELQSFEEQVGQWIPGIFASVILLAIVITGMMNFNSSMQEKKDKMAETLLSSVSSNDLMQGKIIGYFILGLIQVGLWVALGLPAAQIYFDFPILSYLFVPELLLFLAFAIAGYLLFSAMYVALGATIDDFSTAGNFQGLVMMLPFLPLPFLWAIISDPTGTIAVIGSYFPFTASAFMILRLIISPDIPWFEIVISLSVLIASVWVMIKLAGKIYRIGILMYGKNATPAEMIKWLRQ